MTARHYVRFGSHNEQEFIGGDLSGTYEGLAYNANLVAWSATGIAGFVTGRGLHAKPFFIDPLTHAFQHHLSAITNSDGRIKRSVANLVDAYGAPIRDAIAEARRPVVPEDFLSVDVRRGFVQRVLDFQVSTLHEEARESDTRTYLEYVQEDELSLRPEVRICPYFAMNGGDPPRWLDTNIALAVAGLEATEMVGVEVVLGRDLLTDNDMLTRVMETYTEALSPVRYFIWNDGLSEHDASTLELRAVTDVARRLAEGGGGQPTNLYGGFFSSLLMHGDIGLMAAVCHGPQYGESRQLRPVGGGLPTAKFYVRGLHHRLRFREAARLLRSLGWLDSAETYFANVCACPTCQRLIGEYGPDEGFGRYGTTQPLIFQRQGRTVTGEHATRASLVNAAHHYMYAKQWELELIEREGLDAIREELLGAAEECGSVLGHDEVGYLRRWERVIGEQVDS